MSEESEWISLSDFARLHVKHKSTIDKIFDGHRHKTTKQKSDELSSGKWTHGRPISVSNARQMGLNINVNMPREVFEIVRANRVPYKGGPSVWFR